MSHPEDGQSFEQYQRDVASRRDKAEQDAQRQQSQEIRAELTYAADRFGAPLPRLAELQWLLKAVIELKGAVVGAANVALGQFEDDVGEWLSEGKIATFLNTDRTSAGLKHMSFGAYWLHKEGRDALASGFSQGSSGKRAALVMVRRSSWSAFRREYLLKHDLHRRGPLPGSSRNIKLDQALYPQIKKLREEGLSVNAATLKLAGDGAVKGGGTVESKAKRLARRYQEDGGL